MHKNKTFEHVYVENEWYDGPRVGVADVLGQPHRYKSLYDEEGDQYLGTFLIWPIDQTQWNLEVEQWKIFVEWDILRNAGKVDVDTHPGHGGINSRWDEIESVLQTSRSEVPKDARKATVDMQHIESQSRYETAGPNYKLSWKLI